MNENNTNSNNDNLEKQETVNQKGVNTPNAPVGPTAEDNATSHVVETPTTEAPQNVPIPEEKQEQPAYVENEKGGPSKLKTFFAILLFIFFFVYIPFLTSTETWLMMRISHNNAIFICKLFV